MALFGWLSKAKPERKEADKPRNPQTYGLSNQRKKITEYQNDIAASAAMAHPIVARCLNKIATSVQTVDWYAEEDPNVVASERASAGDIKKMNAVLTTPNDDMSPIQLRYWMALNYACFGRVPFKVGLGVELKPNAVYPLAVRFVTTKNDERGRRIGYNYGFGMNEEFYPILGKNNGKSYVFEVYTPNLDGDLDMGCNVTVLRSIGLPTNVINLLLQRALDTASGHPNVKYIISSEKNLTEPQKDSVQEFIDESKPGEAESGQILFLHGQEINVSNLDCDLSDMHTKIPSDDMAKMIYGAFGIPVALMGVTSADSGKFAGNYAESRASFWEDTIIPNYLSPIETGMTAGMCPYGMRIRFDRDSIPALAYSRALKSAALVPVTFLTNDEKRELAGYPPATDAQKAEIKDAIAAAKPTPVATKPDTGATPNANAD